MLTMPIPVRCPLCARAELGPHWRCAVICMAWALDLTELLRRCEIEYSSHGADLFSDWARVSLNLPPNINYYYLNESMPLRFKAVLIERIAFSGPIALNILSPEKGGQSWYALSGPEFEQGQSTGIFQDDQLRVHVRPLVPQGALDPRPHLDGTTRIHLRVRFARRELPDS